MKNRISSAVTLLAGTVIGGIAGAGVAIKKFADSEHKMKEYSDKHLALYQLMNQWVRVKQEGKNLSEYFERNNYRTIAIYGMSYVGETLINELKGTVTQVAYGIDRNADMLCSDVEIVSIDDNLEKVDAIVVTAISFFDEIEDQLVKKVDCPVLSIEDVIYEL